MGFRGFLLASLCRWGNKEGEGGVMIDVSSVSISVSLHVVLHFSRLMRVFYLSFVCI